MGNVISLDARRRRKPDPLVEFTRALDELLEAMELLQAAPQSRETDAAYDAVYSACRMLLSREERNAAAWTR